MATKKKSEPAPQILGFKRICPSCGTRYYDRGQVPPICPSCSTEFNPDALLKSRRSRIIEDEKVAAVADVDDEELLDDDAEVLPVIEGEDLDEDEEGDDALIEDTSELGEDEDDIIEIEDNDEEEDN